MESNRGDIWEGANVAVQNRDGKGVQEAVVLEVCGEELLVSYVADAEGLCEWVPRSCVFLLDTEVPDASRTTWHEQRPAKDMTLAKIDFTRGIMLMDNPQKNLRELLASLERVKAIVSSTPFDYVPFMQYDIAIPRSLRRRMAYDKWCIVNCGVHYVYPRPCTVHDILCLFLDKNNPLDTNVLDRPLAEHFVVDFLALFDCFCNMLTLYACERPADGVPSRSYGVEHLLRFALVLPSLLRRFQISRDDADYICTKCAGLLLFVKSHKVLLYPEVPEVQGPDGPAPRGA